VPAVGSLRNLGLMVGASGIALLAVSGCGSVKHGESNANLIVGKQQFVARCGACHVLARAETKGSVGPNLDIAFRGVKEGLGRTSIRSVVQYQVEYPNPQGAMPKGLASGSVLNDIASYVEAAAARPGKDTGLLASAVAPAGAGKPAEEKAGKLELEAAPGGQLAYTAAKATAKAGQVTIVMKNTSGVVHNVAIQSGTSGPVLGASPLVPKGNDTFSVTLKPGTYTYFCQAPGHRAAGMLGTLTVK
jgi:plastocyanin